MKLSKEFKDLLAQESGELKLNDYFYLKRWTLKPETDVLGRAGEYLQLMAYDNRMGSVRIESRDTEGITAEVEKAMIKLMTDYAENLAKRFKGGLA